MPSWSSPGKDVGYWKPPPKPKATPWTVQPPQGNGVGGGGGSSSFQGLMNAASFTPAPSAGGSITNTPLPPIAPVQDIDHTASNNAIFGRAKDTQGQIGRASLDSLRGLLGETGQMGSGAEVQGTRDIAQSAAGELGQVNRDLASQNAQSAADVAAMNYQGQIQQRAQDLAAQQAQAQLQQQQAQQAAQQQLQMLQLALGQQQFNAKNPTTQAGPAASSPTAPSVKPWWQNPSGKGAPSVGLY